MRGAGVWWEVGVHLGPKRKEDSGNRREGGAGRCVVDGTGACRGWTAEFQRVRAVGEEGCGWSCVGLWGQA